MVSYCICEGRLVQAPIVFGLRVVGLVLVPVLPHHPVYTLFFEQFRAFSCYPSSRETVFLEAFFDLFVEKFHQVFDTQVICMLVQCSIIVNDSSGYYDAKYLGGKIL